MTFCNWFPLEEEEEQHYDPGLCVMCESCYWGSPKSCPQCRIVPQDEEDEDEDSDE